MRTALQNGDHDALRVAVHTLKGSSSNLGAKPLAKLCEALEKKTLKNDFADAGEQTEAIARELARLATILKRERDR